MRALKQSINRPPRKAQSAFSTIWILVICIPFCTASMSITRMGKKIEKLYPDQLSTMLYILDEDIDPCEDFFTHACGYYNEYLYGSTPAAPTDEFIVVQSATDTQIPPFLFNHEDRMRFFEENKHNFNTSMGKILANLYNDCKARDRHDVLHEPALPQWTRMLREIEFLVPHSKMLEGWPFLHYEWLELAEESDATPPDWVYLAAHFAAHGVNSFLKLYFAEQTIFVSPVEEPMDVRCYEVDKIVEMLKPMLDNRGAQAAEVIANELYAFCRDLTAPLSVANSEQNNAVEPVDIFIDDSIADYFQWYFHLLNFSSSDIEQARKLPTDVPRLSAILSLIRRTHPRIVFNFVLWQAYAQLRFEDCFLLTEEFEEILFSEYWQWNVFERHFSRNVAMASYLYHTTRFQKHRKAALMGEHWDRFLYARLQRSDFNLPRLLAEYANTFLDAHNLTRIYDKASLAQGAFYGNLLALRRQRLRNSFFAPYIDAEDYNHPSYFLRHFLHFSILTLKRPLFHYFATEGFSLWRASDLLYSSDGFYTALDCLERQSLLYFDEAPIFQILNESEVASVFRFYRTFMESYRDYKFWLEGEAFAFAEDFVLEYFRVNSERVIFYAVAQQYCGRNDALHAPRINRSFMNMPQFAEAFKCDGEAAMNPPIKCMISKCDE